MNNHVKSESRGVEKELIAEADLVLAHSKETLV
jgi:hypothetical protein